MTNHSPTALRACARTHLPGLSAILEREQRVGQWGRSARVNVYSCPAPLMEMMMISLCMVWRCDQKQTAIETVLAGATHYRKTRGQVPNFVNTPPGFLSEAELAQLRERFTVATNAPAFFRDEIWLGVMTPATDAGSRYGAGERAYSTSDNIFSEGINA